MAEPFLGEIKLVPYNFAPLGWAFCQGQLLPISQNDALFALLGTIYGGDGQSNFQLPDLRGRVPIHQSQSMPIGLVTGTETVTLTTSQIPQHTHLMHASANDGTLNDPTGHFIAKVSKTLGNTYIEQPNSTMNPASVGLAGGNQPHENRQPYLCLNYIVALEGIFPSQG